MEKREDLNRCSIEQSLRSSKTANQLNSRASAVLAHEVGVESLHAQRQPLWAQANKKYIQETLALICHSATKLIFQNIT